MARKKGSSGGFGWGVLLGLVLAAAGGFAYLKWGKPTSGANQKPPASVPVASVPELAAVRRPAHVVRTPPFGISEDVFEAGARIYKTRCASCHGTPGHDAHPVNGHPARQLWKQNGDAVGVSHQQPGTIYEEIASGELQKGMPAFEGQLSETQIWQVSLLLKSAGQQLPDPVMGILTKAK
jgi:mono/diheme cytochrome c family protein